MLRLAPPRPLLGLLAAVALLASSHAADSLLSLARGAMDEPVVVKEPKSKVSFQSWARFATGAREEKPEEQPVLTLTGTGLRTKTIFAVKVYAVGMYVDAVGARQVLAKWSGESVEQLSKNDDFYSALAGAPIHKSLRLVMTRDVDGGDMGEAFSDSLGPRVAKAAKRAEAADAERAKANMKSFKAIFTMDELAEETEILFTSLKGGQLVTSIDGEIQGVLDAPILSRALFDIYLDKEPISDKAKKGLIGRVPELLSQTKGE